MDSYLLERMLEHNRAELSRTRGKRDWASIFRRIR